MTAESTAQTETDDIAERLSSVTFPAAVVLGVGTFLLGYVLTGLLVTIGPSVVDADLATYVVVLGFVFYSAHNVPYETTLGQTNLLADPTTAGQAIPSIVYFAIPIVLSVAAGVVLARSLTDRPLDPIQTLYALLGYSLGYLLVAVAGTFVLTIPGPGGTATLVFERAVLFGLLYPLLFGTIGAGVAAIGTYLQAD